MHQPRPSKAHPFRKRSVKACLLASAASLLAAGGAALWLAPRGLAQDAGMTTPSRQGDAPADAGTPTGRDGGYYEQGADGGSAISPGGGAASDPSVGVDPAGRGDATATRNGRTTRRRTPNPVNPLVILDPTRPADPLRPSDPGYPDRSDPAYPGYSDRSVPADARRGRGQSAPSPYGADNYGTDNRLAPPVAPRRPGDYTLQTDPFTPTRPTLRPLPLFGYDFFQPARQIIITRRLSLLPPPRPAPRRTNLSGRGGTTVTRDQGAANGFNGSDNTGVNGGFDGIGAAGAGQGRTSSGAYEAGAYAASGNGQYDANQSDNGQGNSSQYGDSGSQYGGSQPDSGQGGNGQNRNSQGGDTQYGGDQPGDVQSGGPARQSSDSTNGSGGYDNGGYDNGGYGSGGYDNGGYGSGPALRRRPARNAGNSLGNGAYGGDNFSGDGFGGDAGQNAGGQFPGGDASAQGGPYSVNAVTGQIADPLSSLNTNVLASLPPNYQLQPGDSLTIRYSALTLAPREVTANVDTQGGVSVPGVGRISVAGRTSDQAEAVLRAQLARLYRNVDVSISLRQLRTIQVTVSGAAFAPGTYTVPATATAFNVLNAAGGPQPNGSLRDIRVLRSGRPAGVLDIYPLIGATSGSPRTQGGDIVLRAGDNIYVPAVLSRVSVRGEVRQPAVYELARGETLRDLLAYAGGVKASGVDQNVHIDTVSQTSRVIKDVNLRDKPQVARTALFDGDSVEIASVRALLTNRITVAGAVDQPGDYALTPGMRVADLLARARGPLLNAYLGRAELTRENPDLTTSVVPVNIAAASGGDPLNNITLRPFDMLRLFSRSDVSYLGRRTVTVRGAVQRPGLYTQSDNMRVSDLLLDTGGPLPDAYLNRAILLHQRGDGTYAYEDVNLRGILSGEADEDKAVRDNDVLAVYRIGEAHFTPDHTVKILGDVVAPGLYARGDGMKLSDLLKLAGAFKPGGGTRVTVAHARRPATDQPTQVAPVVVAFDGQGGSPLGTDAALQDGDVVAVQGNGNIKDHPAVVTVTGAVNRPGPFFVTSSMRLSDAVKLAGGLRPEAFPQGAEFTRTADSLATAGQTNLAEVISQMSDMLNLTQYERERAKASLALIEAAGAAASGGGGSSGIALPGLSSGASAAPNTNVAPLIAPLTQINPVSRGRVLTTSQLQPNGSVAVRLAEAIRRPGGMDDTLLKDGDTIVVPETPTTVQVVGAVVYGRGVVYRPGKDIGYYVDQAGDYTPDAAKDRIEVIHAGGGLIPAGKAGAIQPGDLILVPTKVLAEKVGRSGGGFSSFFQGLLGSAITLKVLSSVFGL
jgi:protein involved in polysaccharide export with SLBB domain